MLCLYRRLGHGLLVLIGLSALSFTLAEVAPGTYFDEFKLDPRISPATVAAMRDLGQTEPATAWEAEIDMLMRRQLTTRDVRLRKRLYGRVQELVAQNLPIISLVSPSVLVGTTRGLGNLRPTILDHHALWNVEELFWRGRPSAGPQ